MTETRWLTTSEQQAWRAYLRATRLVEEVLDAQLQRDAGMPHGYYEILVRLSESPNHTLRMTDLASGTGSTRSRLSHAVARLQERGWIERRECPSDRRGQLAVLTPLGMAALEAAAPGHVERVRSALLDPLTPEHVSALGSAMEAIAASLEIELAGECRRDRPLPR